MKADEKAPARLLAWLDALDAWAAGLDADALATELSDGRPASALVRRIGERRTQAVRLGADLAERAEVGLWQDVHALAHVLPGVPLPRTATAGAVRSTLRRLAEAHPGHLVEVRVPPFGAVQIGRPGVNSVHRRGTPPNVVETDAVTWLTMVAGDLTWADALAAHRVSASGAHAQLDDVVPLA